MLRTTLLRVSIIVIAVVVATVGMNGTNEHDTLRAHWSEGEPMRHIVSTIHMPDSADITAEQHKALWRATAEVVGCNLSLWAFDRYVQKGHFAYISWITIRDNFRHGFERDNDHLNTNMFAHPYHGSIYFNAARANGFNFLTWKF